MSGISAAAFRYLVKYGPTAWKLYKSWRQRRRLRKYLERHADLIKQADESDIEDGDNRKVWVLAHLEREFPDFTAEMTESEKNLVNEVVLRDLAGGDELATDEHEVDLVVERVRDQAWTVRGRIT